MGVKRFIRNMQIRLSYEDVPPIIEKAAVYPYPDLKRLWIRLSLTPFQDYPDLDISIMGPDGKVEAEMAVIENRDTYLSLTVHLPNPVPDASYTARFVLSRKGEILYTKEIAFALTFREPEDLATP
jgi:hypothetical protein